MIMELKKKSSVNESNGSLITTIPKVLAEIVGINKKEKIEWVLKDGILTIKPIEK